MVANKKEDGIFRLLFNVKGRRHSPTFLPERLMLSSDTQKSRLLSVGFQGFVSSTITQRQLF